MRQYDNEAYIFDDERLKRIKTFFYNEGDKYFSYHQKDNRLHYRQGIDIMLFFMKEDIYYRARFLEIMNNADQLGKFELDEIEKENIRRWK